MSEHNPINVSQEITMTDGSIGNQVNVGHVVVNYNNTKTDSPTQPWTNIDSLKNILKPQNLINLEASAAAFTGRKGVLEKLDEWLDNPDASPVYWLTGPPGVGKTALIAYLYENRHTKFKEYGGINGEEYLTMMNISYTNGHYEY